jgi:uncharacterized protein
MSMSIVERMRAQLKESMKSRDAVRTNFLRYWIAQLTLGTGEEMPEGDAIKKMRGVLKEARTGVTTFTAEELNLIREWVPLTLTPEQIKEVAGQQVESDDVKAVVATLRQ